MRGNRKGVAILSATLLAAGVFVLGLARASPESDRGLAWLQAQVQADGSLAGESGSIGTPLQGREETLDTLIASGAAAPALATAVSAAPRADSTESLARQVIAQARAHLATGSKVAALVARQSSSGAFGSYAGSRGNALDTAWAVLALRAAGYGDATVLQRALDALTSGVGADGGLAAPTGTSQVYVTSYGLLALLSCRDAYDLTAPINRLYDWLKSQRNADGAWGEIMLDAIASLALATSSTDSSAYAGALQALRGAQSTSGSWRDDPYLTALAIRALVGVAPAASGSGKVTGKVLSAATRAPLGGVTVTVGGVTVSSSASGDFAAPGVPTGSQALVASKEGYAPAHLSVTVTSGGTSNIGSIKLAPAAQSVILRGVVTDAATGGGLAGVGIGVSVDGGAPATASSDTAGAYELTGLSPGSAQIVVSKAGYQSVSASTTFAAGVAYLFSPSLADASQPPATDATLHGRIVDADSGAALAGATITLGARSVASDATGTFSLTGLAPGEVTADITAAGHQHITITAVLGAGDNDLGAIPLPAAATTNTLSGTVTDASSGAPLRGALLRLQGTTQTATSDVNGQYRFTGIGEQVFSVVVEATGYIGQTLTFSPPEFGSYVANVSLARSAANGITLDLSTDQGAYDPYSEIEITGRATSSVAQGVPLIFTVTILDALRNVVDELQVVQLTLGMPSDAAVMTVPANGTLEVVTRWYNLGIAAGDYTAVMRGSDPSGNVVAEGATAFTIQAKQAIGGGINLDPPITQAGTGQSVAITANLINQGNLPLPATGLDLKVILQSPDPSAPATAPATVSLIAQGSPISVPRGAAFDHAGNFYFVNMTGDRKLYRRSPSGTLTAIGSLPPSSSPGVDVRLDANEKVWVLTQTGPIYGFTNGTLVSTVTTGMSNSAGFDVEPNGNFVVAGTLSGSSVVVRVTPSGQRTTLFTPGLNSPYDAVSDGGSMLVSNRGDGTIVRIADNGGMTAAYSGLSSPQGLARDSQGNLYVANSATNSIIRITPAGVKSTFATGISSPQFLDFTPAGDLLVTNGARVVYKVAPNGTVSEFLRALVRAPTGIAYDLAGSLYAASSLGITRLDPGGTVTQLSTTVTGHDAERGPDGAIYFSNADGTIGRLANGVYSTYASGFGKATGIAFGDDGSMYVSDSTGSQVTRVTGGVRTVVGSGFINQPAVAIQRADGTQFIDNAASVGIVETGQPGRILTSGLTPKDMTLSSDGYPYVLYSSGFVDRVNPDGTRTRRATITSVATCLLAGAGPDDMYYDNSAVLSRVNLASGAVTTIASLPGRPYDLARGSDGAIYATTDTRINKVVGSTVTNFATFSAGRSLVVDAAGTVYVANASAVYRIAAGGSPQLLIPIAGVSGLSISAANGHLLVSQSANHVVREYDTAGNAIDSIAGVVAPSDVEWAWGHLFIANGASQVLEMRSDGNPRLFSAIHAEYLEWNGSTLYGTGGANVFAMNPQGATSTFFSDPATTSIQGLAAAPDGMLTLSEDTNDRVLTLNATGGVIRSFASLVAPTGITVGAGGDLYAINFHGTVVRILGDRSQAFLYSTSTLSSTLGLRFGPDGGLYVVSTAGLSRVATNGTVTQLAAAGSGALLKAPQFLGSNVFVVDSANVVRRLAGNTLAPFAMGVGTPTDVREAADGTMYITGGSSGTVTALTGTSLQLVGAGMPTTLLYLELLPGGGLFAGGSTSVYSVQADGTVVDTGLGAFGAFADLRAVAKMPDGRLMLVGGTSNSLQAGLPQHALDLPASGTVVYSSTASAPALGLGDPAVAEAFGSFVPPYAGDYDVVITPQGSSTGGMLQNTLHVGPHATATLIADRATVLPGTATANVDVTAVGGDYAALSKVDVANLRVLASAARPQALGADPAGNIISAEATVIKQISPDGAVTVRYNGTVQNSGQLPVDSAGNIYFFTSGPTRLIKLAPDNTTQTLLTMGADQIRNAVLDSQQRIVFWDASTFELRRRELNGQQTTIGRQRSPDPKALGIDAKDNLYLLDGNETLYKVTPTGETSPYLAEPTFEFEGTTVTADCANNVFLAPSNWAKFNQAGEEHTLLEVIGASGQVGSLMNGLTVSPPIADIDMLVYDRFGGRILIWTDNGLLIYGLPVTCGAIDTDLHVVLSPGQSASAFTVAPSSTLGHADGSTELVWSLKDVTNFGEEIRYATTLSALAVGQRVPLAADAFLIFKNSFASGDIRLPLAVPSVDVVGSIDLSVFTDRAAYPANSEVLASLTVNNPQAVAISGRVHADVLDAAGAEVSVLLDEPVVLPPSGAVSLTPPFNTGTLAAAGYRIAASFTDDAGLLQDEASVDFAISTQASSSSQIAATLSLDQPTYGPSGVVRLADRIASSAVNYTYDNLFADLTITDASGAVIFGVSQDVGQLAPGAAFDGHATFALDGTRLGSFTATVTVTEPGGRILAHASAPFTVQEDVMSELSGHVAVAAPSVLQGGAETCSDRITNTGPRALAALSIRRTLVQTGPARVLDTIAQTINLAPGQTLEWSRDIATAGLPIGSYACVLQVDSAGTWQRLGRAVFGVIEEPTAVSLAATLDRATYDSTDTVAIGETLTSLMRTRSLHGTVLHAVVSNAAGASVFTADSVIGDLAPGASAPGSASFAYHGLAEGAYTVTLTASDSSGKTIGSTQASFLVRENLQRTISGSVSATLASVYQGAPQTCTDVLSNAGVRSLTTLSVRQLLTRGGAALTSSDSQVDLAAGASKSLTRAIDTHALAAADYQCELQAQLDGAWKALGAAGFTVTLEPPGVTLATTTDHTRYDSKDRVVIVSHVVDTAQYRALGGATLHVTVIDAGNTVVFTHDVALSDLAPGASTDSEIVYSFARAAEGAYRVQGRITGAGAQLLASSDAHYDVVENLGRTITGTVTPEKPSVYQGASELCTDVIGNAGVRDVKALPVRRSLTKADGTIVGAAETLSIDVGPDASTTLTRTVSAAALDVGNYSCALEAYVNDAWQPLAQGAFSVTLEPFRITTTLATDQATYDTTDEVTLALAVTSASQYRTLQGAHALITLTASSATTPALSQDVTLADLAPGATLQPPAVLALDRLAEGAYTLTVTIVDAAGLELARATVDLAVAENLQRTITGSVAASAPSVYQGAPVACTDVLANAGVRNVTGLPIRRALRTDAAATIVSTDSSVNLAPGASMTLERALDSGALAAGSYACTLQASIDGAWKALGSAAFAVEAEPYRIGASLASDRASYDTTDEAHITASLTSANQYRALDGATLTLTIAGSGGAIVSTQSATIAHLAPGGSVEQSFGWTLGGAGEGAYTLALTLTAASGAVVASAQETISVVENLHRTITGTIAAAQGGIL